VVSAGMGHKMVSWDKEMKIHRLASPDPGA